MRTVNIYDFDHTIYRGDSSVDFIAYCFLRRPSLCVHTPKMMWSLVMYVFGTNSKEQVKQTMFGFLKDIEDPSDLVRSFWAKNTAKIKQWYLSQKDPSDIIITASPEFLVTPVLEKLSIKHVIATDIDINTGKISGKNCTGTEKVRRLLQNYPDVTVRNAYGDSISDTPMLEVAEHGYLVRGDTISHFSADKKPTSTIFKSRSFIRFLAVGGINAFIGIAFAYVASLFISSTQVAFIVGFSIGLLPSYFLNSAITFRDFSYSFNKFAKFVVSYIPNLLIQLALVHTLASTLNPYPLITFIAAVVIATPITFALLSLYAFRKKHA